MARGGPRPGAGRPRKAAELKAAIGTIRKDRDGKTPDAVTPGPMTAPMHLSDLEQLLFGSIADLLEGQKRASPDYDEVVALLSIRLAQVQMYKAVLEVEGSTYESKTVKTVGKETIVTTRVYARPEVAMLSDAMRQSQSLLGELMLNPSAALRIASGHKPEPGAFDDF